MKNSLTVRRFTPDNCDRWNSFVKSAKNGTFLHDRGFMEYHSDRFTDHSLVIEKNDQIVALLPANQTEEILHSHAGLTYGGLITGKTMSASLMMEIPSLIKSYMQNAGFEKLLYKSIPHVFHKYPAEEDIYALLMHGANIARTDLASVVDIHYGPSLSKSKRQGIKRAKMAGLTVEETNNFGPFWKILENRLSEAHQAMPTHSRNEITRLKNLFPNNIRLFQAVDTSEVHGGILVFDCEYTLHSQYMATTNFGRENAALDLIMSHLSNTMFEDKRWFSFGISTTNGGKILNSGLARQKEMFGARSVVFHQYELTV